MSTQRPWKVVEHISHADRVGYIKIIGPGGENVADIFPFGAKGGVGLEEARENAALIVMLANTAGIQIKGEGK